jgi:hypothetical protein
VALHTRERDNPAFVPFSKSENIGRAAKLGLLPILDVALDEREDLHFSRY